MSARERRFEATSPLWRGDGVAVGRPPRAAVTRRVWRYCLLSSAT